MSGRSNLASLFFAAAVAGAMRLASAVYRTEKDPLAISTPAGNGKRQSVAKGKRQDRKARNVRRHRLAIKRKGART